MRRTVQLVRLVSVKYCKRLMSKVEVVVFLVFIVDYRVEAWLLSKEVALSSVSLRNALPLRRWMLCLSSLFLPSFLFPQVVVAVMLTDDVSLCPEDSSAFLVVAAAEFLSVFCDRRHRPVAADDVWKMLLLAAVPVGSAGATVVVVVVVVLVAEVALVVAVDVAAVEAAGSMGIYSTKSSSSSSLACAAALLSVRGVKLLVLQACDTGKAYPPAPS
jgi:hypothetical protein